MEEVRMQEREGGGATLYGPHSEEGWDRGGEVQGDADQGGLRLLLQA